MLKNSVNSLLTMVLKATQKLCKNGSKNGLKTPSTPYLGHSDLDMKIRDFTNFSSTKFNNFDKINLF